MNRRMVMAGSVLAVFMVLAPLRGIGAQERNWFDPKALDIVKRLCQSYAGMSAGSIDVKQNLDVTGPGTTSNDVRDVHVLFVRPDRIRVEIRGDEGRVVIVSDGKKRYEYVEPRHQYIETDAPGDITAVAASGLVRNLNMATARGLMVLELLSSDANASLMEGVTGARYGGVEKVGDVACHHVKLAQRGVVWELWATKEEAPRLVKTSADLTRMANVRDGRRIVVTSLFEEREGGGEPGEDAFAFAVPEDAQRVDTFGLGDAQELVGKMAPDFEMDLLDGGKMKLSALRGERIVILDFWATWCGPCRMAMPILEAVAKDYAEKGVELYGVNQDESAEVIRAFLTETGLSVTVGLDPEARIGDRYAASSIPQTVIVGKDGTVKAVQVGVSPTLDSELRAQLDALVAGKEIVAE